MSIDPDFNRRLSELEERIRAWPTEDFVAREAARAVADVALRRAEQDIDHLRRQLEASRSHALKATEAFNEAERRAGAREVMLRAAEQQVEELKGRIDRRDAETAVLRRDMLAERMRADALARQSAEGELEAVEAEHRGLMLAGRLEAARMLAAGRPQSSGEAGGGKDVSDPPADATVTIPATMAMSLFRLGRARSSRDGKGR